MVVKQSTWIEMMASKCEVVITVNRTLFLSSLFILTIPNVVIFIRNINVIFKELGTGTSSCSWMTQLYNG